MIEDTLKEIENIETMEDSGSESYMYRLAVTFKNGLILSIIRGVGSCGYEEDLFEIAIFNIDREIITEIILPDEEAVVGYLTEEEVYDLAKKISCL